MASICAPSSRKRFERTICIYICYKESRGGERIERGGCAVHREQNGRSSIFRVSFPLFLKEPVSAFHPCNDIFFHY